MTDISKIFGSMVFNDAVMRERLPEDTYTALKKAKFEGRHLSGDVAVVVAAAMKDWALEKGATHYTHWFQPLTGITAEKHDSFLAHCGDGKIMMEFSAKELIRGETDGSSFPSGGLRATFEARGYTAWDPTSYAFIKNNTLCIPTAFCSYDGKALDKKTPLLRSMEVINRQALRILRLFGNETATAVRTTVGPEQEYFLIDRELYLKRRDLVYTGRTLFGAKPPKGQELADHYFGSLKPRVAAFMADLDEELWKLGVLAKTEHNEVAPAQHELAPIFTTSNIAADHNQLTMEIMQQVAKRHGMVCLLHEKPFAGVNGSGKHNNWSLQTNDGVNLLSPGDTPYDNAQFLLFLCAVIEAVDEYQDLLRISVASAGNDHRLGAGEAPPAVISIYLGDELSAILDAIASDAPYTAGEKTSLKVGVHVLPRIPRDTSDRNRTSPFAFTGNKFEFRMPGSSESISDANTVINTAVAESLRRFADELEGAEDFENALHALIKRCIIDHRRILFSGNGYDEAWIKEAAERGLSNYRTTPDCLPHLLDKKNVELFERHGVFTEDELRSRRDINLGNYCKRIRIEAATMAKIVRKDILPAVAEYSAVLCRSALDKKALLPGSACRYEESSVARLDELSAELYERTISLENSLPEIRGDAGVYDSSVVYRDVVIPAMQALRVTADELESIMSREYWPFPTYGDLLQRDD